MCGVKPHVLRYWEQEFKQLRPMKRRGNRRYYQHHEVLVIRKIRELLYEQGFTIVGARNRLDELAKSESEPQVNDEADGHSHTAVFAEAASEMPFSDKRISSGIGDSHDTTAPPQGLQRVRRELLEIRDLLRVA